MDSASNQAGQIASDGRWGIAIRLAPLATFLITLLGLLIWGYATAPTVGAVATTNGWPISPSMISGIGFCVVALIVSYGVRLLLQSDASAAPHAVQAYSRDRIALYVVGVGTIGIIAMGMAAIFSIDGKNGDTSRSIFSAVLPVFSTWVGTVLAAYFSNESFRQASNANQATSTDGPDSESVTRGGTMVPFERIIRYEMTADQVKDKPIWDAAAAIPYAELEKRFQPPGVVRIVIFDDKRHPVYVLRHDTTLTDEQRKTATLGDVLTGAAKDSARNFAWTAASALVTDAKRLFELRKVTDLFVTQNGRTDEPVLGWVPDDNLRPAT